MDSNPDEPRDVTPSPLAWIALVLALVLLLASRTEALQIGPEGPFTGEPLSIEYPDTVFVGDPFTISFSQDLTGLETNLASIGLTYDSSVIDFVSNTSTALNTDGVDWKVGEELLNPDWCDLGRCWPIAQITWDLTLWELDGTWTGDLTYRTLEEGTHTFDFDPDEWFWFNAPMPDPIQITAVVRPSSGPVGPVPEPGGALIFAAGLLASRRFSCPGRRWRRSR